MKIHQISVFLENRPGRLLHLLQALTAAQVNLRALSVADTADFGIARLVVSDTDAALKAIRQAGLTAATTEVLHVQVPDTPGGLAKAVIGPLAEAGVNVEYVYAFSERLAEQAVVVLKVDDPDRAEEVLR